MDIEEYISSGVIELYAMGALTPEGMMGVEQVAAVYPAVALELVRVQETLNDYSLANSTNPRPSLRADIIENIVPSENGKKERRKEKRHHRKGTSSGTYKFLLAACIVALLMSTAATYFFFDRWNDADDRYVNSVKEKYRLQQDSLQLKQAYDKTYADISVMRNENMRMFALIPIDTTKLYSTHIFWNRYSHETFIDMVNLPTAPSGKQYQLWAMVSGKPVDAGMIIIDNTEGMKKMVPIENAEGWAVTLEPMGGSPSPSMDQIYLKG